MNVKNRQFHAWGPQAQNGVKVTPRCRFCGQTRSASSGARCPAYVPSRERGQIIRYN